MNDSLQSVLDLVEKFERNIEEYKNPKYNETLIRVEFVNPFSKRLDGMSIMRRDMPWPIVT